MSYFPSSLRLWLHLAAGLALALAAREFWFHAPPPAKPEIIVAPPTLAQIGLPGEISLRFCSWHRPRISEWLLHLPAEWASNPWRSDWRGWTRQGWQWQLRCQFWPVQLASESELTVRGPGATAYTGNLPEVQPRDGLEAPLPPAAAKLMENHQPALGWLIALALLCVLTDALGLIWRSCRPRARLLRRLAKLPYTPEQALWLRRCWQCNRGLALGQPELSRQLNRLCFQLAPGKEILFNQLRQNLRGALLRYPNYPLNHPRNTRNYEGKTTCGPERLPG